MNNSNNYTDNYFKLTGDISLGGNPWTPIGNYKINSAYFSGNFDGGGHKITGFYCNNAGNYSGLFGYTIGATIKNVTVEGTECNGGKYAGGIVAQAKTGTKIINCINKVLMVKGEQVGGIVGRIEAGDNLVLCCINYGTVVATGTTTYAYAAGIAAAAGGTTVAYCANYGNISSSASSGYATAGGVVGMHGADDMAGIVKYCLNSGNVYAASTASTTYKQRVGSGGIVGRANHVEGGEISYCATIGEYTSSYENRNGAIFGNNFNLGIINNCYTDNSVKFGHDSVSCFTGDEVTILSADAIRGENALTNMGLDASFFAPVQDALPAFKIQAILVDWGFLSEPEETTSDTTALSQLRSNQLLMKRHRQQHRVILLPKPQHR